MVREPCTATLCSDFIVLKRTTTARKEVRSIACIDIPTAVIQLHNTFHLGPWKKQKKGAFSPPFFSFADICREKAFPSLFQPFIRNAKKSFLLTYWALATTSSAKLSPKPMPQRYPMGMAIHVQSTVECQVLGGAVTITRPSRSSRNLPIYS